MNLLYNGAGGCWNEAHGAAEVILFLKDEVARVAKMYAR